MRSIVGGFLLSLCIGLIAQNANTACVREGMTCTSPFIERPAICNFPEHPTLGTGPIHSVEGPDGRLLVSSFVDGVTYIFNPALFPIDFAVEEFNNTLVSCPVDRQLPPVEIFPALHAFVIDNVGRVFASGHGELKIYQLGLTKTSGGNTNYCEFREVPLPTSGDIPSGIFDGVSVEPGSIDEITVVSTDESSSKLWKITNAHTASPTWTKLADLTDIRADHISWHWNGFMVSIAGHRRGKCVAWVPISSTVFGLEAGVSILGTFPGEHPDGSTFGHSTTASKRDNIYFNFNEGKLVEFQLDFGSLLPGTTTLVTPASIVTQNTSICTGGTRGDGVMVKSSDARLLVTQAGVIQEVRDPVEDVEVPSFMMPGSSLPMNIQVAVAAFDTQGCIRPEGLAHSLMVRMQHVAKAISEGKFRLARQKARSEVLASIENGISRNHFECPDTAERLIEMVNGLLAAIPDIDTEGAVRINPKHARIKNSSGRGFFNPLLGETTSLRFNVPSEQNVTVSVLTLGHELVATLANETFPTGTQVVQWDGRNSGGAIVASGVYVVLVEGSDFTVSKRVLLKK